MYIKTRATSKLERLSKRIRGIAGGTSASKTISILLLLIQYAQTHDNQKISVVSESFPHLKRGAIRDFLDIMEAHKYFDPAAWNKTDSLYTFETKSIMEFFSADQPGKVRGPRRDILFINEANNISYETFTQLEIRTKKVIWLDWNPVSEFWFYDGLDKEPAVKDRKDCDFMILTYRDNEALDPRVVEAIEARRGNANWWKVYGEGLLGDAEGRIYKEWEVIDKVPHQADLRRYGLDFGYTNDPTAIVGIYYYNGGYIFNEICYQHKMTNKDIADRMLNEKPALVVADSAEPKSIDEIKKNHGVNIIGASKGRGSVLQGIQNVQAQRISVAKSSVNLLKEYRNYLWMTDKEGKIINEPQEFLNHFMDAIRYGMDSFRPLRPIKQDSDVGGILPYIEGVG